MSMVLAEEFVPKFCDFDLWFIGNTNIHVLLCYNSLILWFK